MMKNQKGITLIALVITIIVLLILAGVSIAMLTGNDGILTRAGEASTETKISEAKEMTTLLINEMTTDYFNAKYVDEDDAVIGTALGDYIETNWQSKTEYKEYITSITGGKITLNVKNDAGKAVTGTIDENGKVNWD